MTSAPAAGEFPRSGLVDTHFLVLVVVGIVRAEREEQGQCHVEDRKCLMTFRSIVKTSLSRKGEAYEFETQKLNELELETCLVYLKM